MTGARQAQPWTAAAGPSSPGQPALLRTTVGRYATVTSLQR